MAKTTYKTISSQIIIENRTITSYGIACYDNNVLHESIPDISPDKHLVDNATKAFNSGKLDKSQFDDAIEDLVTECYTYAK